MFALRLSAVLTLAAATSALAQEQQSFTALQAAGFEVKTSDYIPIEGTQRINPKSTGDAILLTMQKGPQVAVCYFAFSNWVFMNKESLADTSLCEVR